MRISWSNNARSSYRFLAVYIERTGGIGRGCRVMCAVVQCLQQQRKHMDVTDLENRIAVEFLTFLSGRANALELHHTEQVQCIAGEPFPSNLGNGCMRNLPRAYAAHSRILQSENLFETCNEWRTTDRVAIHV